MIDHSNTLPKTSLNIILAKLKLYGSSEVRYRLDQIGNQKLRKLYVAAAVIVACADHFWSDRGHT